MNFRIPAKKHSSRLGYVTKLRTLLPGFFAGTTVGPGPPFGPSRLHAMRPASME